MCTSINECMMYVLLFVFFLSLVKFIFLFFVCMPLYGEIKICIIIQVVYSIQVRSASLSEIRQIAAYLLL